MLLGTNPVRASSALWILSVCLRAQCPDTARFTPIAILDNGVDSARLEVVPGGGASAVMLKIESGVPLVVQGISACNGALTVPLYDDGTHGDRVARDGVFTVDGIRWHASAPANCSARTFTRTAPSLTGVYPGDITIVRSSGSTTIPFNQYALWMLPVSEFGAPEPVSRLAADVQVSAHVVNIADDAESVNRILSGEAGISVQTLSSKVYSALPDVYDFLSFTTTSQRLCPGGKSVGWHMLVKQTWTGTGTPPFDTSASYGSAGKLLGIQLIEQQSSDYFPVFAHETVHQWADYLPAALGISGAGGHWADNTNIAGAVGGGAWTPNGDGTYWAAPSGWISRWRVSPLELYLMGLAPVSETPAILVSDSAPISFGQNGSRVVGPFRQVAMAQIQQLAGVRTPGPEAAQRAFRTAFVVTTPGRLLTQTEMTAYDRISRMYTGALPPRPGNNRPTFDEITGGRATLETSTLPCAFTFTPSNLSVGAAGSFGTVAITVSGSYCRWSVAGGSWITIMGATAGSGSGSFSYSIAPNTGASSRSGFITLNGTVAVERMPVMQESQGVAPAVPAILRPVGITSDCQVADAACLDSIVTRSQMAVFLIRALMGGDNFSYSTLPYFNDVPASHPQFAWIQKMRELGITSGCGDRQYCPGSPVTRGEMAVFLIRAQLGIAAGQGFPFASRPYFNDVPMTHPFFPYIQKLRESGITLGCSPTEYCPAMTTTRWQMSIFLLRAFFAI
jgi:S-layer homology domain/Putative binding domain, N-terminal